MGILKTPAVYGWRVYVMLDGGMKMHLCTCDTPEGVESVVRTLTGVDKPQYSEITLEAECDLRAVT